MPTVDPSSDLIAALAQLLAAEEAGAHVAVDSLKQTREARERALLERIHRGEADSCRRLRHCLKHLGQTPEHARGVFYEKAMAIADLGERLAFIDRGQRWVIRRIEALLPSVPDALIRTELEAVLQTHRDNSQPDA